MAKKPELTPVMQQYVDLKKECADAVLLFRLGDFYECFFDDARTVARTLDLVLTHRGRDADDNDIPMCGIPWHASDNYLGRLVRAGHNVAIAEQMESPEQMKARGAKQIDRKIVRILTAGTLTDDTLLTPGAANFLVAVFQKKSTDTFDIAGCDISTGDFFVGDLSTSDLYDEITRLNPAEILYPESAAETAAIGKLRGTFRTTPVYDRLFERGNIQEISAEIFGLDAIQINPAINLLAGYLDQTQRGAALSFRAPHRLGAGARLLIDGATWKSLEIDQPLGPGGATLLKVLDRTKTAAGARKLRTYLRELSGDMSVIQSRQIHIGHLLMNTDVFNNIRVLLSRIPDVGRALSRLSSGRGHPRDLKGVSEFLLNLPMIKSAGMKLDTDLAAAFAHIETHDAIGAELKMALADDLPTLFRDGNVIRVGYDGALDHINGLAHGAKETIAGLQAEYAAATDVSTLKIKYNNILGYHIEVPSTRADKLFAAPDLFIHRQTMAGNIRFTTSRLIELDNEVRGAAEKASAVEGEIINRLVDMIKNISDDLLGTADLMAAVDVWAALAECADRYGWVRPVITNDCTFDVRGGRHPVVEKILKARADHFVKNDCVLATMSPETGNSDNKSHISSHGGFIALLTGPNMAGKSTYLRQNALIVVLAHLGSFVPADSATIGICDQLFSRVGASDNLAAGQSTFMVEMVETANILNRMTDKSFIIFDEIGRGTATFDGLSIAWAVLEYLDRAHPRTLFATHYHELTAMAADGLVRHVKCLTIDVAEHNNEIIFMHKIINGVAKSSYGIHVAKMAGMPTAVVDRAGAVLANLESGGGGCTPVTPVASTTTPSTPPKVSEPPKKSQMTLF